MNEQGSHDPEAQPATTAPLAAPPRFPHTNVGPGPRAENEARLGRRVGPYRLDRLLGHGGMGAVYLARRDDGEFEREVALKLIRHGGEDEISRRRFERERRILSRLEHPAIARLYDGGVDEETGLPWFAMERIEGENLGVWCAQRRLSLRERVALVIAIGHAVQYAHQQLVIHRDLKPSNILVDQHGAPHVLDFGIAAILDESEADRTSPRTTINTPEYAAPEQIEGAPISAATDVYTLGVILFELLTGVRPFEDPQASAFSIQRAVLEARTPSLTSRLTDSPETGHGDCSSVPPRRRNGGACCAAIWMRSCARRWRSVRRIATPRCRPSSRICSAGSTAARCRRRGPAWPIASTSSCADIAWRSR